MRFTIGNKIILGYIPVVALIFVVAVFTLVRLNEVNRINREIVDVHLIVSQAAEDMVEVLVAQESYGQRYLILKSQDMLSLFWKRDQEFSNLLQQVQNLPEERRPPALAAVVGQHSDYAKYFQATIQHLDSSASKSFSLADSLRRDAFEKQTEALHVLAEQSKGRQALRTRQTAEIGRVTFRALLAISVLGSILAVGIAIVISHGIHGSILTLRAATGLVSQGRFDKLPTVRANDELGELSAAFNEMAVRLARLEEIYMDSSPLTRLPGGIAIEASVENRIAQKKPFAFCMLDLDNFKPFNDRYGYSRGNAVIKHTASIIQQCSKELGEKDDFIGHIGGDDFALVTAADRFGPICEKIIQTFDNDIAGFYDEEDRERGHIVSKSRQGETLKFPIMTISIAAVDSTKSHVENHIEVGEIIAELKKYAKSFKESKLVVDRRGGKKKRKKNDAAQNSG